VEFGAYSRSQLQLAISWSGSIIFSITWCFPKSEKNGEHFLIIFFDFCLRNKCGELRCTTFDLCYAKRIGRKISETKSDEQDINLQAMLRTKFDF
jgi:hypothetical protein